MISRRKLIFLTSLIFFVSSFFMDRFQEIPGFPLISGLFIISFALPSYFSLISHLGFRKGFTVLTVLSIIPVLVEGFAVWTGFPYGNFKYGDRLGWLILDLVPPTISLAYLPILLGSMYLASQKNEKITHFSLLSSFFNLLVDLVIDPAAVDIGFWTYTTGGIYYNVPLINFIGWLVTGFIYSNIFHMIVGREKLPLPSGVAVSLIWILSYWSGYLLSAKLYLPMLLGFTLLTYSLKEIPKYSVKQVRNNSQRI